MSVVLALAASLCVASLVIAVLGFLFQDAYPKASFIFSLLAQCQLCIVAWMAFFEFITLENLLAWSLTGVCFVQTLWFATPSVRVGWSIVAACVMFLITIFSAGRNELAIIPCGVAAMHLISLCFCVRSARRQWD